MVKKIIAGLLILLFGITNAQAKLWVSYVGTSTPTPPAEGYQYSKNITINDNQVSGTQTNFPFLFSGTYTYLKSTTWGGSVTSASGFDIIFGTSSNAKFDHEVEFYGSQTGQIVAWVRLSELATTTTFSVYFGNSAITVSQENIAAVWNTNYQGVWHQDETSGLVYDSTSNGNNGTANGGVSLDAVGKIDGADSFDGANDYVSVPDSALWYTGNYLTVESWAKADALGGSKNIASYDASDYKWIHAYTGDAEQTIFRSYIRTASGIIYAGDFTASTGVWYHLVTVYDATLSSERLKLYVNGVKEASATGYAQPITNGDEGITIGRWNGNNYFNGTIDELRISNTARSAGWITTEFNNQNNPAAFYSITD